jgi:hypothetical protein
MRASRSRRTTTTTATSPQFYRGNQSPPILPRWQQVHRRSPGVATTTAAVERLLDSTSGAPARRAAAKKVHHSTVATAVDDYMTRSRRAKKDHSLPWQQVRRRSPGVATTTATSPQFYRGKAQECEHRSASTGLRRPRGHLSTLLGGANNTTINQDEEPLHTRGPR